jgi:hypothetical protein
MLSCYHLSHSLAPDPPENGYLVDALRDLDERPVRKCVDHCIGAGQPLERLRHRSRIRVNTPLAPSWFAHTLPFLLGASVRRVFAVRLALATRLSLSDR